MFSGLGNSVCLFSGQHLACSSFYYLAHLWNMSINRSVRAIWPNISSCWPDTQKTGIVDNKSWSSSLLFLLYFHLLVNLGDSLFILSFSKQVKKESFIFLVFLSTHELVWFVWIHWPAPSWFEFGLSTNCGCSSCLFCTIAVWHMTSALHTPIAGVSTNMWLVFRN